MGDVVAALAGGRAHVVYVAGDAAFLVDRAAREAEAWGVDRCGLPSVNHGSWSADADDAGEALSAARTLPMMSELRVVVLRDVHLGTDGLRADLLAYLESPNPSTLLIVTAGKFGRVTKGGTHWAKKLPEAAGRHGIVLRHDSKGIDPVRFAIEHARELGHELGRREASLLVEVAGADVAVLAAELAKIGLHAGVGRPITFDDVAAVSVVGVPANLVWELTGGVAARDADRALGALHRVLSAGEPPHRVLSLLAWQVRSVLQADELLASGVPDREVARRVRVRGDVIAALRRAAKRPNAAASLERLVRANRDLNSHRAGGERVLEGLVLSLCSG